MLWNPEKNINQIRDQADYLNTAELVTLQAELNALKTAQGERAPRCRLFLAIDRQLEKFDPRTVQRRRYIRLALLCGWFAGGHRLYAGQRFTGLLYLLFCWTGIPFAMTVLDLMAVLPMQADAEGNIQL